MSEERSIRSPRARSRAAKGGGGRKTGATATLEVAQANVGGFLRATRERLKLTQAQVAQRTKDSPWQLSRAAVSAIERGQNFPGLEAMLALSNVLQIDPKELLERARIAAVVPVDVTGVDDKELEKQAGQYFWAGDFKRALSVYDAMVEKLALEQHDSPEKMAERLATLEVRRATALKRAGALISAIASAERAIVVASRLPVIQAEAYVVLADLQVQRGHLPLARDAAERAIELASESGSPKVVAWAWLVKGRVHFLAGSHDEARAAFQEAKRGIERSGDARHLTHIEGNIGMCHLAKGDLDLARKSLERAVAAARAQKQPALEASWLIEHGKISFRRRRYEEADRLARESLRVCRRMGHLLTVFRAEWLRHRVVRARDPQSADARRMAVLEELFPQIEQHEGIDEIREYKQAILSSISATKGGRR